ncbi:GH24029 [Drosophila grimshawi]|uniref:GH24029 n=1 Tax=Drosophila grimshawi TaxID=7222 RepID=B4K116_DROGR|nr:GH24029 [Drosophila grimshawi]
MGSVISASLFALVGEEYASNDDKIRKRLELPLNDSFSIEAVNVAMQVVQNDFDVTQLCKRKTAKVKPICISKLEEILKLVDCKL